jgi:hypothetical protein
MLVINGVGYSNGATVSVGAQLDTGGRRVHASPGGTWPR